MKGRAIDRMINKPIHLTIKLSYKQALALLGQLTDRIQQEKIKHRFDIKHNKSRDRYDERY